MVLKSYKRWLFRKLYLGWCSSAHSLQGVFSSYLGSKTKESLGIWVPLEANSFNNFAVSWNLIWVMQLFIKAVGQNICRLTAGRGFRIAKNCTKIMDDGNWTKKDILMVHIIKTNDRKTGLSFWRDTLKSFPMTVDETWFKRPLHESLMTSDFFGQNDSRIIFYSRF